VPETKEALGHIQGRKRFERICNETAHNLYIVALKDTSKIEVDAIETENGNIYVKDRDVWAVPKPLP
jgi:hypothetical protein